MHKNVILICIIILVNQSIFGQEKVAKGVVFDETKHLFIEGAIVNVETTDITVYSDEEGEFNIIIPKRHHYLLISKDGYKTAKIALKPGFQRKILKTYLFPLTDIDSTFNRFKNAISLSLLELFNGAIAVRYEHFLKRKHSIGIHSSFYLFGRNPITMGSEHDHYVKYMGIKASPFYRYYMIRKGDFGLYGEGKIQFGYIHFSELGYYNGSGQNKYDRAYSEQSFWSMGFGVSVGIMFKLQKRRIGNVSIGYQYFPIHVPETIEVDHPSGQTLPYTVDVDWWYKGGPGSYLDIKFTLGISY